MATAAVKLQPLFTGSQAVSVPSDGTSGFYRLTPSGEPASVGAAPIAPSLGDGVDLSWPTRFVTGASNHVTACPIDVAQRGRCVVRWGGLTMAQRDTLIAWLNVTVGVRLNSFDFAIDGPGSAFVVVRPVKRFEDRWEAKTSYTVEVECEEVF